MSKIEQWSNIPIQVWKIESPLEAFTKVFIQQLKAAIEQEMKTDETLPFKFTELKRK